MKYRKRTDACAFWKKDAVLTFRTPLIAAVGYLLLIPMIRGVANLDAARSAQCLSQSVSLAGAVLLVPICRNEMDAGIREIVGSRPRPYRNTLLIRMLTGTVLTALLITGFTVMMKWKNCSFPLWSFTTLTILYACFMGLFGLAVSRMSDSMVTGALAALGYWSMCQMGVISEQSILYLYPVVSTAADGEKAVVLILADAVLIWGVLMRDGIVMRRGKWKG